MLSVFRVCINVLSVPCSLVVTHRERAVLMTLLHALFYSVLSLSNMVTLVSSGI